MIYKLEFERRALKEWKKLGAPVQEQFKKNWQKDYSTHIFRQHA